jgi:7-keto-8-aminopelargonate synthetase-like enzyme
MGRVDIITSTLGKALGGALGGFTSGKKEIIDLLRQRSRPYLFSNSLAPGIVGAALKVLDMLSENTELRDKVMENAEYFRTEMKAKGFDIPDGDADCSCDVIRCEIGTKFCRKNDGKRRLCHRFLLSSSSERKSQN